MKPKVKKLIQDLHRALAEAQLGPDDQLKVNNEIRALLSAFPVKRPLRPTAVVCLYPGCKALVNRRSRPQYCGDHRPIVCKSCWKPFRTEELRWRDYLCYRRKCKVKAFKGWWLGVCPSCLAKEAGLTLLQFIEKNREDHQELEEKVQEDYRQLQQCSRNRQDMRKAYSVFVQVLREQLPALFRWCVGEQIDLTVEDEPDFPWEKRAQVQFVWAWNTLSLAWELGHRGYLEYVMIFVRQGLTYRAQAQIDSKANVLSEKAQELGRLHALKIREEIFGRKIEESDESKESTDCGAAIGGGLGG